MLCEDLLTNLRGSFRRPGPICKLTSIMPSHLIRYYAIRETGTAKIESEWTACRRQLEAKALGGHDDAHPSAQNAEGWGTLSLGYAKGAPPA
jgi:hypothetical protein